MDPLSYLAAGRSLRTLVDIGANDGEFAAHLCRLFSFERVIAIEPLPEFGSALRAKGYETHSVALSRSTGVAKLNVSGQRAASSLLPMASVTLAEWPSAANDGEVEVRLVALDDIATDLDGDFMIKMDAQGAEADILLGGRGTFSRAAVVLVEHCFVPLYEGQALFNELHAGLADCGLQLTGFRGQHTSSETGRPLFCHCVYERT